MLALRSRRWIAALPVALLALAAGCAEERTTTTGAGASAVTPDADQGEEKVELRRTVGETTQDIRDFETEIQKPGAQVASQQITAQDPLTMSGNAYVTQTAKLAIMNIDRALQFFEINEGRYPDYEEFMERVVKAEGITLPQLPGYQEYAYDAKNHKLVVVEFPDRKEQLREQVRGGR
ncbi:hypothetical protein BH23PLA1_BH23PLA1_28190 [soil metagenome]